MAPSSSAEEACEPGSVIDGMFVLECAADMVGEHSGGLLVRQWTNGWDSIYGCEGVAVVDEAGMSGILELASCDAGWFTGWVY